MTDPQHVLSATEVEAEGLDDWRMMFSALHARFATGDFVTGVRLIGEIETAAEEMNHHPDVDLSYPQVDVRLTSHDVGGVSSRDIDLARRISGFAAALGAAAKPADTTVLEVGLDTWDRAEITPFWAAVLGYEAPEGEDRELQDPDGKRPTLWFQDTARHDLPAQRFHFDIRVPPEVVQGRIDAALAAGGTLVADDEAPAFWVLADAQGNRCCLTTWQGRD